MIKMTGIVISMTIITAMLLQWECQPPPEPEMQANPNTHFRFLLEVHMVAALEMSVLLEEQIAKERLPRLVSIDFQRL